MSGQRFVPLLLCLLAMLPLPAAAEDPAKQPSSEVQINMQDTNIRSFIEWIAKATGKNFIIDPRVTGKVTVISNEAMKPEEAYRVFLSVLQVHGFSAIESDSAIKVIPDANAKQTGVPLVNDDQLNDDQQVVRVIRTQHVPATQLVNILRPMVPQVGHLAAYPDSNAMVISDRASNINQLMKLISEIDRAGQFEIDVIPLKFASAKELSAIIGNLVPQAGGEGSSKMNVSVDERTNSVLISGDPSKRQQLRDVLSNLDKPGNIVRDTQVLYLHYLKASDVAQILQNVASSLQKQDKDVGISGAEISIQANDTTNALVISAPPAIMKTVEDVVARLDIRRAQVLVEAVIVEVSDNKVNDIGVQWRTSDGSIGGDGFYGGFTSSARGNSIDTFPGSPTVNLDAGFSMGFYRNNSLRALIKALSTDDSMNILSTPNLVTLDNEEGKIVVGQNVPFVTGSSTSASNPSTNPFQTIERQDVGITLKIKPQINEGDSVTLNIYQEISSVTNDTSAADIVTNKRSIETRVLVQDNMTLVLGGLISDEMRDSGDKVPFLGKVPVIGRLFRSERKEVNKKNLMVFIKPTIINDFHLADQLTEGKYNFIRDRQLRYANGEISQGVPALPEKISAQRKELQTIPLETTSPPLPQQ
ncbi:type II secretion system secretin GspD [Phytopseudomonas dryadis]|uniref:type II secretion system secretin GspD n=1 Tax=Pseudomonadaceae TaxID=135621 RepID=UPI0013F14AB4|nr:MULTISPECIES: type II secretion system secretin GspD [Pseudomonas]